MLAPKFDPSDYSNLQHFTLVKTVKPNREAASKPEHAVAILVTAWIVGGFAGTIVLFKLLRRHTNPAARQKPSS